MSTFRLHGYYSRCECMLVEPLLLLLSKLPTGKNLIVYSGILSALGVLPRKLQSLFWRPFHHSHGPKTHSLNLPGCIVELKCPCAAGVKHLSLPVSSNHPSLEILSTVLKVIRNTASSYFIIGGRYLSSSVASGFWFLCLSFGLWKAHSTIVLQLLGLFFMELQGFANRKPGLSGSEKFGYRLLKSDGLARKYSRL